MIHSKNGAECELFVGWSMNYFGVDYQLFWSELSIILIILGAEYFSKKLGVPSVISL